MDQITPTNVLYVAAVLVVLGLGAIVYLFGDSIRAAGFVTFATPVLVLFVAIIQATQNEQNHTENRARIADLEEKVQHK